MKIEIFLTERNDVEKTKTMLHDALCLVVDNAEIHFSRSDSQKDRIHISGRSKQQVADLQIVLESLLKILELKK